MERRTFLGQLSALFAAGAAAATPKALKAALSPEAKQEAVEKAATARTLAQEQLKTLDESQPIGKVLRPMRGRPGCYLVAVEMAVPMRLTGKALEEVKEKTTGIYRQWPYGGGSRYYSSPPYVWLRDIQEVAISADEDTNPFQIEPNEV